MHCSSAHFDDVHLHAGAIVGWQQTYDQLSEGHPHTFLRHVTGERFQLFQETLDTRVVQRGKAPEGRLCLAIPLGQERSGMFQGQNLGSEQVALLRGGETFFVQAEAGMRLLAITVDLARFARVAAFELSDEQLHRLGHSTRLQVPAAQLQQATQRLQRLLEVHDHPLDERWVEQQVLEALLDVLGQADDISRRRSGNKAVGSYLVRRCQELVMAQADEPLGILELCEQLKVSRRTLQSAFHDATGMRPVEYLRAVRLNEARRRLRDRPAPDTSVSRIANDLGFTHLSHFAVQYKRLFGERPSHTLGAAVGAH
ncbi:helix-turn-helix domain-containing protein [Pseudomonas cremoricolorata]|uniref:helix-turn-helix domain-containing protein n=1 Tax=Pseudomonas cremoricolorata TaxID=157783 RepID=UPI0003FDF9AB|nr:helix-turn-helix domain-containing protein [Pseudomonas cremoricolorata]